MKNKTQNAMRADRKDRDSAVEELLYCGSKRAARAFDRYLFVRFLDLVEANYPSRPKMCAPLQVLADEPKHRKTMTGKEVLQFWVFLNKGNTAKRLLDSIEKAEEAAEKRPPRSGTAPRRCSHDALRDLLPCEYHSRSIR